MPVYPIGSCRDCGERCFHLPCPAPELGVDSEALILTCLNCGRVADDELGLADRDPDQEHPSGGRRVT